MFKPLSLQVKTPRAAFKVIKNDIVPEREKFRFVRAIIESGSVRYTLDVLRLSERTGLKLSSAWTRNAAMAVLEKGRLEDWMKCFAILLDAGQFETVRLKLLKKILSCNHNDWLMNLERKGSEMSPMAYNDFWGSNFTPAEVKMVFDKVVVLETNNADGLVELLSLSAHAAEPFLSQEQREQLNRAIRALSQDGT